MELQNKRIPQDEFESIRSEILTQWPTGKDVNLEEAFAYHKALPEHKIFGKKLSDAKKQGITLVLSHVNEQPMKVMEKGGFLEKVGEQNICENIDAAIERAEFIVSQPKAKTK